MGDKGTREPALPEEYREHWERHANTIRERLAEFTAVPREEYFFELLYCLLTPQSKAVNAEQVIAKLRVLDYPAVDLDPTPILRDPAHYIRFHNEKGKRVRLLREGWKEVDRRLVETTSSADLRDWLVHNVNGLGWKEASHFLRNIGRLDLAIVDRHILKHLLRTGAIDEIPRTITRRRYLDLEERFVRLAASYALTLQELDLLFWSMEEGSVRK